MPGIAHLFLLEMLENVDDCSLGSEGKDSESRLKWFDTRECEQGAKKPVIGTADSSILH